MKAELLLEKIAERIDASARETREHVDASVKAAAQETREYVDASVKASAQETRECVDATVKVTEAALGERHPRGEEHAWNRLRALVEDALHPIRVVAGGHEMLRRKVDELFAKTASIEQRTVHLEVGVAALRDEMSHGIEEHRDEMRAGDAALREELAVFRTEVRGEFAEVRRVARVESAVSDLPARVRRWEERAGA
jgi:hypothetical protein